MKLARKYHPDNYHDNPLADLAQEKMKEINAAYEQITKERAAGSGRSGSGGSYGGYGSGYGGYQELRRTMAVATRATAVRAPCLQQVRIAINTGNLSRAEALLANYSDHNAEWNFLRGAVCYRRGWMDEAKRYYQTACQMDPGNAEYRQALEYMESGGRQRPIVPAAASSARICAAETSACRLCCAVPLCNGWRLLRFCC